jgi:hypothetical protein
MRTWMGDNVSSQKRGVPDEKSLEERSYQMGRRDVSARCRSQRDGLR